MNPYDCRLELRPRAPAEVIDLCWVVLRAWWAPLARLSAAVLLPAWLACVLAARMVGDGWVVFGLATLLAPALQAPFTLAAARMLFAEARPLRDVLQSSAARMPRVAVVVLVQAVVLTVGICSGSVLWVPLQAATLYVTETLLLEGVTLPRALRRSALLSGEVLGKAVFGTVFLGGLAAWCVVGVELVGQAVVRDLLLLGTPFGSLGEGEVTPFVLLGLLLAQPLVAVYRLLLYVDVRTVLEGWDLQVALKAAGEDAS